MIWWPWLLAAFGVGAGVGAWLTILALMHVKLQIDDARAEGYRPPR